MQLLEHYYKTTIKYDLIYKFNYKNLKTIPKLKKIILNFKCPARDLKSLAISSLALRILTKNRPNITIAKKANLTLKIRKGHPVGCCVLLTKKLMYQFFAQFVMKILPKKKNIPLIFGTINNFTYNFTDLLIFKEFEKNYFLFNNLKNIHITFLANASKKEEFFFLFNSFKFARKRAGIFVEIA